MSFNVGVMETYPHIKEASNLAYERETQISKQGARQPYFYLKEHPPQQKTVVYQQGARSLD